MLSGSNGECDETRSILKPSRSISNHFFFHLTSYLPKNSHEQVIQKMVYASKTYDIGDLKKMFAIIIIVTIIVVVFVIF